MHSADTIGILHSSQATHLKGSKMSTLTLHVTLVSTTEFSRENHHIPSQYGPIVERFVCVTMRDADGDLFVNMTRCDTKFAQDIHGLLPGDSFVVGCKFKELRSDDEYGNRTQVTNCVLGGHQITAKQAIVNSAKESRKAKRLAALGL